MDKATEEILKIMQMSDEEQDKYFEAMAPDKTSTVLVDDLMKKPASETRDAMVVRAKAFGYDDFKFTIMYNDCLCPKMKLYEDAEEAGYEDIAKNVAKGKYD